MGHVELKKTIVNTLIGGLSFDYAERIRAEDQIKILETTESRFSLFLEFLSILLLN